MCYRKRLKHARESRLLFSLFFEIPTGPDKLVRAWRHTPHDLAKDVLELGWRRWTSECGPRRPLPKSILLPWRLEQEAFVSARASSGDTCKQLKNKVQWSRLREWQTISWGTTTQWNTVLGLAKRCVTMTRPMIT